MVDLGTRVWGQHYKVFKNFKNTLYKNSSTFYTLPSKFFKNFLKVFKTSYIFTYCPQ